MDAAHVAARSNNPGRWPGWLIPAILVAITSPLALYWWNLIVAGSIAFDWDVYVEAGRRAWAGSQRLYEQNATYGFRHSPIMAYLMPLVAWIGTIGVRLISIGSVAALPTWRMRIVGLASWPFAMDVQHGALISIYVLFASWALRGHRWAGVSFIALATVSPRPLMLPIAVFLLATQPGLRRPVLAVVILHAGLVLASGYGFAWIAALLTVGTDQIGTLLNLSPSRLIGAAWIPIGVVLATWLTYRGHLGLAALAANPYVLPHYLLLLLLELDRSAWNHRRLRFGTRDP